jgi:hypothetical protein
MNKNIIDIFNDFEIKTTHSSSTWFNGHGYFPLHTTKIIFSIENWELLVSYEHKESEFTKANSLYSAYCERHLFEISAINRKVNEFPEFKITFYDSFASLFRLGSTSARIKSENSEMKNKMYILEELKLIDNLVKVNSDFSPEIIGTKGLYSFEINLNFQMTSSPANEIDACFKFLRLLLTRELKE